MPYGPGPRGGANVRTAPLAGSTRPTTPFCPVNQSAPPRSKVAVFSAAFGNGTAKRRISSDPESTRTSSLRPPSVIHGAPSAATMTPCGADPAPSAIRRTVPVAGSSQPSSPDPCAVNHTPPSRAGATSCGRIPAGTAKVDTDAEDAVGLGADVESVRSEAVVGRGVSATPAGAHATAMSSAMTIDRIERDHPRSRRGSLGETRPSLDDRERGAPRPWAGEIPLDLPQQRVDLRFRREAQQPWPQRRGELERQREVGMPMRQRFDVRAHRRLDAERAQEVRAAHADVEVAARGAEGLAGERDETLRRDAMRMEPPGRRVRVLERDDTAARDEAPVCRDLLLATAEWREQESRVDDRERARRQSRVEDVVAHQLDVPQTLRR